MAVSEETVIMLKRDVDQLRTELRLAKLVSGDSDAVNRMYTVLQSLQNQINDQARQIEAMQLAMKLLINEKAG